MLSLGVTSLVAVYDLSELFSHFRRNNSQVEVFVTEDTPRFLEHLLIDGELDVAIMISNVLSEPQAMVSATSARSPHRMWMASNHALTTRGEIMLANCAACDQIVLEADRIDELMTGVWARHRLKPRVILRNSSLEAVRSQVGASAGIAVLPDILYGPWTLDAEHVEVRALRDEIPTIDAGPVGCRGSGLKPAASEFLELLREAARTRRP
jgi:DNA-binding transcriptional LysR family regulator